ncbi:MAG: hypothetical protein ACUVTB_00185 [Candidatus Bathycorpusculaceae bacterium]
MESAIEKRITYFRFCGEVNTEKVLQAAKLRCTETGISKVVIASETGRSAIKALKVFKGTKIKLIVVTHYPATTWGPKRDTHRIKAKRTCRKTQETGRKRSKNCPRDKTFRASHPLHKLGISNPQKA